MKKAITLILPTIIALFIIVIGAYYYLQPKSGNNDSTMIDVISHLAFNKGHKLQQENELTV